MNNKEEIYIEIKTQLEDSDYKIIDDEFNKFAIKNEINCDYKTFNFIAKENEKIIGIIAGHTYYEEIYIENLIVLEEYRNRNIGSQLLQKVEDNYKNKGFKNINLTTYNFQAPKFYEKKGYTMEFIRENKENSKLSKYYFVKYL